MEYRLSVDPSLGKERWGHPQPRPYVSYSLSTAGTLSAPTHRGVDQKSDFTGLSQAGASPSDRRHRQS